MSQERPPRRQRPQGRPGEYPPQARPPQHGADAERGQHLPRRQDQRPRRAAPPAPAYREPRRSRERGPAPDERPTEILRVDRGLLPGIDPAPARRDVRDDDPYDDGYDDGWYYEDEYYDDYEDDYDELDEDRADPEYFAGERDPDDHDGRRGRGRKVFRWIAALGVIVLLAGAAYFGARELLGFGYEDYAGAGEAQVLVEVASGDTTRKIAKTLADADVVASPDAFVEASDGAGDVRGIQPGYYLMKTKMSGANAVRLIVADSTRVGELQIRAGTQLSDIKMPDGSVHPGIYTLLSKASCADINGQSTCVPADELRKTVETVDLAALGVPEWAVADAARVEGARKLEGLIAPGLYDVRPGSDARTLLADVLAKSSLRLQAAGLPDVAEGTGHSPYQLLVVASLIQREAVQQDFAKVSRVVYNRIAEGMKLEFDSTINYVLHEPLVRTDPEDRARPGPYNTYLNTGLPPTPIAAPSPEAIDAAASPADGDWLFFVKCEKNGLSCFASTYEEHQSNVALAQQRGAY